MSNVSATTSSDTASSATGGARDGPDAAAADSPAEGNQHKTYIREKRKELLTHMLRSLDIIVYLHLSYLYFLDCSFIRFALRSAIQFIFLTPKIMYLPLPPHTRSPVITIFGSFALCAFLHMWEPNPAAGELTHGYLHGGLIIDFIGQEGPIAKSRLVAVDTAVFLLQLVMLSLEICKQEMLPEAMEEGEAIGPALSSSQDVENEERGQIRTPLLTPQRLSDTLHDTHSDDGWELRAAELERQVYEVTSGEFEVARLDIVTVVTKLWADNEGAPRRRARGTATVAAAGPRWRFSIEGSRSW